MVTPAIVNPLPLQHHQAVVWLERFHYVVQVHYPKQSVKNVFLALCGDECYSLLSKLVSPSSLSDKQYVFSFTPCTNVNDINLRELLLNHLRPKTIIHYERYKFFQLQQGSASIPDYVACVRGAAMLCEFGDLLDGLLLTQFINGLTDNYLKKKLLVLDNLTVDNAVHIAQVHVVANSMDMNGCESGISQLTPTERNVNECEGDVNECEGVSRLSLSKREYTCYCCGKSGHMRSECKFKNATCHICHVKGHIASVCHKKRSKFLNHSSPIMCSIKHDSSMYKRILFVDGHSVEFLIDSGSPVTVIPKRFLSHNKELSSAPLVRCYNGDPLRTLGITTVNLKYGDKCGNFNAFVIDGPNIPILGCDVLNSFEMIQIAPISIDGQKVEAELIPCLNLHNQILPKYKPRSLPFSIRTKVEDDIKEKIQSGILVPEPHPLMACPIVPVIKPDGTVRVCGDYSVTANKYIDAEQYPLPTLEDITTYMVGCHYFSKLDLKNAYLQVPLSPQSQRLTTISTTLGFFNCTKLPFGISAAPRIFQQYIDNILHVPNVRAYQDDILIGGITKEDHDCKLRLVLDTLHKYNLLVNESKSEFCKTSVHFLGFLLSSRGLCPDPKRLVQLDNISSPSTAKLLKSILGTLQFYSKFTSSFSSLAAPLYRLLSPKIQFKWEASHETILRKLISEVQLSHFLVHYDQKKPLYLTTDASGMGLGAVLSHDPQRLQIIHCASRILTKAEKHYSNIEKEALAVIYGIKRFHQYLSGRDFIIQCDHAPLKFIFDTTKPINDRISSRLQRWCLVLKSYNFSVVNIKGESMLLPDCLSRLSDANFNNDEDLTISFMLNENDIPLFHDIQYHSKTSEISKIIHYVQTKWPARVPKKFLPYTRDRLEYTIHNGCLYRGFRIVVPPAIRNKVVEHFHQFHPGIVRMRQLMRQFVWWPGMDGDIQKHVSSCSSCLQNQSSRGNCHLSSWPDSSHFFQRLFIDICFFDDRQFLVIVDHFSGFIDVHHLSSLNTQPIIVALSQTFRYFGFPKEIVCDNGRQFVSTLFRDFLRDHNIELCLTPPYHSQSNGKVERAIRSLKLFLNKNSSQISSINQLTSWFCMVSNFFPNSNGLIPCREYLSSNPRTIMTKILVSDKRGINVDKTPSISTGSSVVPLDKNRTAHAGGVIHLSNRTRKPNSLYFNNDFVTY
jgi:hypothetical protein